MVSPEHSLAEVMSQPARLLSKKGNINAASETLCDYGDSGLVRLWFAQSCAGETLSGTRWSRNCGKRRANFAPASALYNLGRRYGHVLRQRRLGHETRQSLSPAR